MALLQGTKKLFSPLLNDLDCVSAVKEAINILAFFGVNSRYKLTNFVVVKVT
jgi:hypothetical protein